jgi:hypothetical protein
MNNNIDNGEDGGGGGAAAADARDVEVAAAAAAAGEDEDVDPNLGSPLFEVLLSEMPLEVLQWEVQQGPHLVRRWYQDHRNVRLLPIHAAGRSLLEPWPESIRQRTRDANAQLPVHIACAYGMIEGNADEAEAAEAEALETVQVFVEAWPESLGERDAKRRLPLHSAFMDVHSSNPPLSVIRYLVRMHPGALGEKDAEGMLPIHHAVKANHVGLPVVRFLIEQCPDPLLQELVTERDGILWREAARAGRNDIVQLLD